MNRPKSTGPRTPRPTELSPGPSEVGFDFLLWRARRVDMKRVDELMLAEAAEQLQAERQRLA